jgi:hypothetical protein
VPLAALLVACAASGRAQGPSIRHVPFEGLAIEHDPIGCLVARQHPKLSACFDEAAALARARVYFRADAGRHWYFVEMIADPPCYAGVLPQPATAGGKVVYYVEALDKTFVETRTGEFRPQVVASGRECPKDRVAAPSVQNASIVLGSAGAGAPAVPFGFASRGIDGVGPSGTRMALVVGGGVAALGAAAAALGGSAVDASPGASLPARGAPPPAGTPSTPSASNRPPVLDCNVDPSNGRGTVPFELTINLCRSLDPDGDPLSYSFSFGDGGGESGFCRETHIYATPGSYAAVACVTDNVPEHRRCCTTSVSVDASAPRPPTPVPTPTPRGVVEPDETSLGWISRLEVAGGAGQVTLNGAETSFQREGLARGAARLRAGANRIEAQLLDAKGRGGTWRFELAGLALVPGSIRVIAGEVALVTPDAVGFHLKGRPGERVVFSFRTRR